MTWYPQACCQRCGRAFVAGDRVTEVRLARAVNTAEGFIATDRVFAQHAAYAHLVCPYPGELI